MRSAGAIRLVDVVVIGDGPAGSALVAACHRRGVDVVLVGPDEDWTPTYAAWADELADLEALSDLPSPSSVLSTVLPSIAVHTDRSLQIERQYGVIDNAALQAATRSGIEHLRGRVTEVLSTTDGGTRHRVTFTPVDGTPVELRARLVVDSTGWPPAFARRTGTAPPAWQTAIGVVLPEPPAGDLGVPTWMDFRPVGVSAADDRRSTIGPSGVTTFCYSLPVHDGWLVEETVLAARPAIEPIALLPRLAARLGRHPDDLLADAVRTEYVRIPMGGARVAAGQAVAAFGAAAGYVHPATGFSVTASLRAAPRVADAISSALAATSSASTGDVALVADAVWPTSQRRTRVLYDYGLEMLLRLDDDEVRSFFGAFFELPVEQWSRYLRIDSSPTEVAGVMRRLFSASSWPMRRRLMSGNPASFARLVRP